MFPETPLQTTVEIALGADLTDPGTWTWTDVSVYARQTTPATARRGRTDLDSSTPAQHLTMDMDNRDGRWSRLNPGSPWYGLIGPGTPIRVQVTYDTGETTQRWQGHISELPLRWAPGLNDAWVPLAADGVIRRLTRDQNVQAPLRVEVLEHDPVAYWPLEDPPGSVSAESATGGAPARPFALAEQGYPRRFPDPGTVDGPPGSRAGPNYPQAFCGYLGDLPVIADTAWSVSFWFWSEPPSSGGLQPAQISASTGVTRWVIEVEPTLLRVTARASDGTSYGFVQMDLESLGRDAMDGDWHQVAITLEQSGGSIATTVWWDDVSQSTSITATLGRPTQARAMDYQVFNLGVDDRSTMHLAVFDRVLTATEVADMRAAGLGYPGESAEDRIARVCALEDVDATIVAGADDSEELGPQPIAPLLEILQDAEDSDRGILHEATNGGLRYVTRSALYDAAVTPVLDLEVGQCVDPAAPRDDDQDLINDATVDRRGGATAQVTDETSISARGRYPVSRQVSLASDDQVVDHAGWIVHHGTVDGYRWTQLRVIINKLNPSQVAAWAAVDIGSLVRVTQALPGLPPEQIEGLVTGYTERWAALSWEVDLYLTPAAPWRVGVLGDADHGRLDTAGSRTVAAIDGSATEVLVGTDEGPPWITTDEHGSEFPFDAALGGERVTVTGIGDGITDDFDRTVAAGGWGTTSSGFDWTPESTTTDFEVTPGTGIIHQATNNSRTITCDVNVGDADFAVTAQVAELVTGDLLFPGLCARRGAPTDFYMGDIVVNTDQTIQARIRRAVGGSFSTLVTSPALSGLTHTTGLLMRIRMRLTGPVIRVRIWDAAGAEPAVWHATAVDTGVTGVGDIGIRSQTNNSNTNYPLDIAFSDWVVHSPQAFTVTRGVNGVTPAHSAGTNVSLWTPAVVAL